MKGKFFKNLLYPFDNSFVSIVVVDGIIREIYKGYSFPAGSFSDFEIRDYQGKSMIVPKFVDSHTHLIWLGLEKELLDLSSMNSREEVLECVYNYVKNNPEKEVIIGRGWDERGWEDKKFFDKNDLDKISKEKVILLIRVDGHFAVCNTKALEKIPSGTFGVDREKGFLYEEVPLNFPKYFPISEEDLRNSALKGQDEAFAKNVQEVHEIGNLDNWKIYRKLADEGKLKIRVRFYLYKDFLDFAPDKGQYGDNLYFEGIKVFVDGSIGARTAYVKMGYKDSNSRGKLLVSEDEVKYIIRKSFEKNLQVMFHCIGDKALDFLLSVLEDIKDLKGEYIRIEHLEIFDKKAVNVIKRLNLNISMQPNFVLNWQMKGGLYEKVFGWGFAKKMNNFRILLENGVTVGFGSDCMPFDPVYGILGALLHPAYPVDLKTALKAYTFGSASLIPGNSTSDLKEGVLFDNFQIINFQNINHEET